MRARDATGVSAVIDAYGRVLPGKLLGQGVYGKIDARPAAGAAAHGVRCTGATSPFCPACSRLSASLICQFRNATLRRNGKSRLSHKSL